jgi:hypothetical protein
MATPFVQGRLLNQFLRIDIRTKCAHCNEAIHFNLDSQMRYAIHTSGAEPLIFQPHVNWDEFSEANIIQAY